MKANVATIPNVDLVELLSRNIYGRLFPEHLQIVPQLNEVYELEIAFHESRILTDEEIIRNAAYFAKVSDQFTRHYLMCSGEAVRLPQHSSSRLRSFFQTNQFKTGYGTHGLFPYRGKFHPQMIKGLMNIMGLKPGETVLDPMMGSGTVLIEARLMGIRSVGIDASPFCQFMVQAKIDGLTVPLEPIRDAVKRAESVFLYFRNQAGHPTGETLNLFEPSNHDLFPLMDSAGAQRLCLDEVTGELPASCNSEQVQRFLLLAYLDAAGYSQRSKRKQPYVQFKAILERYLFVAEKIQSVLEGAESELAEATPLEGDARALPMEDGSIDGILFSPPYSFAIDYLENDEFHLAYMGLDIEKLRQGMVGLRGAEQKQKYEYYRTDMEKVLSECARVLRPGRICTIVVGTNNNQLSKILKVPPDEVRGIDEMMCELGAPYGLKLIRKLSRQITGMANTMRNEYIVMLQRS